MKTHFLFREYIWLINTIRRARRITLEEINRRWVETDMSGGVEMARTTFYRHKCAIEDIFGIYIECDKRNGNKYHIGNEEVLREDSVQNWMLSTLSVGNMVEESQSLHKRILLEHVPSGDDRLPLVIRAMKESRMISLNYRRYGSSENGTYTLAPFCVKLFHQRWYLVASFESGLKSIYAFDRIEKMELLDAKFKMDEDFDAAEFFTNSYGIVVDGRIACERIVLRAYGYERYYLRDLPFHHSQREINTSEEFSDFELKLKPTADFKAQLMSRGQWIEVLEPQSLADEIVEWHKNAIERYKK